ncbi:unnamed protein product [Camellia sinensis]
MAVYEELGKYGDLQNQVLYRERVEELEPSIRYCLHKLGESNLQTSELMHIGEMEGPALDLFKAKLEAVMAEARSQQAASMTEFHWLGHKFPISNAKTRVSILKDHSEKELKEKANQLLSKREEAVVVENELDARTKDVENVKLALESLLYEEGQMEALQKDRAAELELNFDRTRVNGVVAKLIKVKDGFTMTALEGGGGGDLLRQLHALVEVESKLSIHQKRLSEIEAESAGGGKNVSAHKENGLSNSMERDLLPFQSMGPHMFLMAVPVMNVAPNHLHVLLVIFIKIIHFFVTGVGVKRENVKLGSHLWACPTLYVSGVYSSTSDPVVVAPLNSQIPNVGAIKCEINSQRIAAESGAFNPSGKRSSKLKESQILEKNQPLEPSKEIFPE